MTKAQKRRLNKSLKEKEIRRQAEEEAANMVNHKELEEKAFASLLTSLKLRIKEV